MSHRETVASLPVVQLSPGPRSLDRASITTPDGEVLAWAVVEVGDTPLTVTLGRISAGKGRLLGYYFGEGGRAVTIARNGYLLPGMLQTRWVDGERKWTIRLRAPGEAGLRTSA